MNSVKMIESGCFFWIKNFPIFCHVVQHDGHWKLNQIMNCYLLAILGFITLPQTYPVHNSCLHIPPSSDIYKLPIDYNKYLHEGKE